MTDPSPSPEPNRRPVLVAVDPTASAREAASWAADVAARSAVPLTLLHVSATPEVPGWLSELAGSLGPMATTVVATDPDPSADRVGDLLVERSAGAGLLVVGSFGEGSSGGLLAGTLAARLVGATRCPLVVVRGAEPGSPRPVDGPVVVGVDSLAARTPVLDAATDLAVVLSAPLLVVHAWSDVVAAPGGGARRVAGDWTSLAADADALLRDVGARVAARAPGLDVETRALRDTALRGMLDLARTARLLVVGPRRDHRPPARDEGMMVGSTSRGLVGFAPCPVVVVPT
ncbi:MAG: universal stress protein [Pseudonocardia sp.]|nr:universal stress protein [Pseudonocardia sp.]